LNIKASGFLKILLLIYRCTLHCNPEDHNSAHHNQVCLDRTSSISCKCIQGSRSPDFLTLEDGTNRLSRNIGTELPLYAAQYPRRAQMTLRINQIMRSDMFWPKWSSSGHLALYRCKQLQLHLKLSSPCMYYYNNMYFHQLVDKIKIKYKENFTKTCRDSCEVFYTFYFNFVYELMKIHVVVIAITLICTIRSRSQLYIHQHKYFQS
jgi:hypothetical protein